MVFHGAIAELRAQAPEQGHRISTDDDERALDIARRHAQLAVEQDADGGLVVRGSQDDIDQLVRALVDQGLALRALELSEAPLETLFFMLTESHSDGSVLVATGAAV